MHQFETFRKMGGFGSITHNLNQTHNLSYIRLMAIPFFESVLAQRLPLDESSKLRDMNETIAWLGDTITKGINIYKASTFIGNKQAMSWLPDSVCAVKYREYIETGTIRDKTAPSAPFNVKIIKSKSTCRKIIWEADADIESGIKYFNIYKNDKVVGRYPDNADFQTFNTNGDNPIPSIAPDMYFDISGIISGKSDSFAVSTINRDGLESLKTIAGQ